MKRGLRACAGGAVVLAAALLAPTGNARADDRHEEARRGIERLNKEHGIVTDGKGSGPGKSPHDLATKWAAAMSDGNMRGAIGLIVRDWWTTCAEPARKAEREKMEALAKAMGGLFVTAPRGVKLTRAEAVSPAKRVKKGEELDGCVAKGELVVQRWRFTVQKGSAKPIAQEYELLAADGAWALRAP